MPQAGNESAAFPFSPRVQGWLLGLLLIAATVLAYQPAWTGKPIWDDDAHLTKPELRSLTGLARIWIKPGATQQYYPLVHSVFWVEYKLWGDSTLGYHLVNIFLHAIAALLLLKILRTLQIPAAGLAAAIFALHPVQVESVAWISELKNTLSAVFYFGSMLAYLRFDRTKSKPAYAIALMLFTLGLMSKTVIATLPAALLVIFWWKRGRLSWKQDALPLIPFFIAGIAAGLFTAWMERHFIGAQGADFSFSIVERFLIAGRAIWFYLEKLFWPANLIFTYPRWNVSQTTGWQYLFPAAAALLLVALWSLRRQWRGPLAAMLFFVGTLFPALGFFNVYPFRFSFVADHFQCLACIGPIVLASVGINTFFHSRRERSLLWERTFCVMLLATLCVLTWRQSRMYADVETLWRTTINRNPACWMAYNNLGYALLQEGRENEAVLYFQKALAIKPDYAEAYNNLGIILLQKGRTDEAAVLFQKALTIMPDYAEAHNNLGMALCQKGQVDEAIIHYQKALEIQPDLAAAENNLGNTLFQKGQVDEAIMHYQKALEIQPNLATAENNLGNVLFQKGRVDEAIAHYQKALAIAPDYAEAHNNLGMALFQKGQVDEAIAHYQKALEIQPGYAHAQNNLNKALLLKGK